MILSLVWNAKLYSLILAAVLQPTLTWYALPFPSPSPLRDATSGLSADVQVSGLKAWQLLKRPTTDVLLGLLRRSYLPVDLCRLGMRYVISWN